MQYNLGINNCLFFLFLLILALFLLFLLLLLLWILNLTIGHDRRQCGLQTIVFQKVEFLILRPILDLQGQYFILGCNSLRTPSFSFLRWGLSGLDDSAVTYIIPGIDPSFLEARILWMVKVYEDNYIKKQVSFRKLISFPSFFSFLVSPLLPTHCRSRRLLLGPITLSDTDTLGVNPLDERSAGRREMHLRNNTQHSQGTNVHAPARFVFAIPATERPQTYAIDSAVAVMVIFTSLREVFIFPSSSCD